MMCVVINDHQEMCYDGILNEVTTQDGLVKFAMLHENEIPIKTTVMIISWLNYAS